MEKLFYPESIAIFGLSNKQSNIPRLVLENLIRWGFKGRIFGINPRTDDLHVRGIHMYKTVEDLPVVPDLAFTLIPAKLIPETIEACGRFGIRRMAIPSGGFNELGEEGRKLAENSMQAARRHAIRFVGPNGVTIANTENGLCLPFVPSFSPPKGGLSIITQSGGVGLMLWNFMTDENVGMAKFASIGNKLDLDEVDFLEYFGRDPRTTVIGLYLESLPRGDRFIAAARKIDKPIIVLKSNTTSAGRKAAMSHTAAVSSNEDIINAAFEDANIIRIDRFSEFISVTKAFNLPPMKGNRIMAMSPAGGFGVMMADLIEKSAFEFADPGAKFFDSLKGYSNAGVINFSNPLDMGDIYDPRMYAHIFYTVMHNDNVDGAVYVSQWPHMPRGEDVFHKMFQTDLSKETIGALLSSGKPLAVCLFGLSKTKSKIKQHLSFPLFDNVEEMIFALRKQSTWHIRHRQSRDRPAEPEGIDLEAGQAWIAANPGDSGEEALELLQAFGIGSPSNAVAASEEEAVATANKLGYPLVMKVVSPDALHKTDAGGVMLDLTDEAQVRRAFVAIRENLSAYNPNARFDGVRLATMADEGHDMFIGGKRDDSFGPVVVFGYGGIYIEVFKDTKSVLCPAARNTVRSKVASLRSCPVLKGVRGKKSSNIEEFIFMIERVSHLMAAFPEIKELDINPVRVGKGATALDARVRIVHSGED